MAALMQNAKVQSRAKFSKAGILMIWHSANINATKWLQSVLAMGFLKWHITVPTYRLYPLLHQASKHIPFPNQSLLRQRLHRELKSSNINRLPLMSPHSKLRCNHSNSKSIWENAYVQTMLMYVLYILCTVPLLMYIPRRVPLKVVFWQVTQTKMISQPLHRIITSRDK